MGVDLELDGGGRDEVMELRGGRVMGVEGVQQTAEVE